MTFQCFQFSSISPRITEGEKNVLKSNCTPRLTLQSKDGFTLEIRQLFFNEAGVKLNQCYILKKTLKKDIPLHAVYKPISEQRRIIARRSFWWI